jgi:arabinogalactan oligomer/maltooligosaccharide transport system substrate-binding protein
MKNLSRLSSLVAVAVIAAACSSASATPTAAPTPTPAAPSASAMTSETPTTVPTAATLSGKLTIWEAYGASGKSEKDAFDAMVDLVMHDNPGLNVTVLDVPFNNLFTKFETAAATGGGPDLYIAPNDNLPTEARANLLVDVSSLKDTLMAAPYSESQVAIDAATVDGKLYEIPESMKAVGFFYRTDMLATPPKTTDDWLTTVKGGTKLGLVYGANGGGAYYQWGFYGSFGGTILDPTTGKCAATANSGVADSLKFLSDFKKAGGVLYQNDTDAKAAFIKGTIAGFIDGPWMTGDLRTALGDKLAVVPGPTGPAGKPFAPMSAPDGFYINKASKNIDLAQQFALAMLTHEQVFVDQAGHIPANTTIQITDPITQGFADVIKTGFARPTAAELNNYWGNFGNAIVAVVDKGTDPTAAVADACTAMDKANKK